jgi:molybdenum cofactor biosynthesis protein B
MSETSIAHKAGAPRSLNFALIVCSTSRSESLKRHERFRDQSGDLVVEKLKNNGHRVTVRRIVPDDRDVIQKNLMRLLRSRKVDAIITCGGTGVGPRDLTIKAVKPLLDKEIQGFGEIFRHLSYEEIGSAAVLTNALAGVVKGKAIFCIPGSPQGASLAVDKLILPEAGHILKHSREA